MLKYISTHKGGILSALLMIAAVMLGADCGFAMAVDVVGSDAVDGAAANVQNEETVRERAQTDTSGLDTQLQGEPANATTVRDAKIEAEDIDPKVAKFRPFRFPIEWYIASRCQQVKSASYVHGHFRSGATVLEDFNESQFTIGRTTKSVSCGQFTNNAAALTEYSEVFVAGVDGYAADGKTVDGDLALYVVSNDGETVKFVAINPIGTGEITIPVNSKFVVGATACSESQMLVAPEAYLPERDDLYLQKKIANVIITDEWEQMAKKVEFIVKDVLHNGLYNFKRKCARTHWLGRQARIDVKVKELNNSIESTYFERGILRQIPMVYTYNGTEFTINDFFGMSRLQFAKNSESNTAVAFCGQNAIERIMKLAYKTADHEGSIEFQDVTEMGINVHKWHDLYGTIEFVHDPTLDDIGYDDFIAIIDIDNAVRYWKRNEKTETQDLKKTGESREAKRTIISMIDCIGLKGYNAVLVTPASKLADTLQLGGVSSIVESAPEGLSSTTSLDTGKKYYLGYALDSFAAGTIIEHNGTSWVEFSGELNAA